MLLKTPGGLSENTVISIASRYASELFGDKFDGLTDEVSVSTSTSGNRYYVRFDKRFGEDGFIVGAWCAVSMTLDGTVTMCSMPQGALLEGFDETLFNGISSSDVSAYTENAASGEFSELSAFECTDITLEKIDGKYVLKADASFVVDSSVAKEAEALISTNRYDLAINEFDIDTPENITYKIFAHYYFPLED